MCTDFAGRPQSQVLEVKRSCVQGQHGVGTIARTVLCSLLVTMPVSLDREVTITAVVLVDFCVESLPLTDCPSNKPFLLPARCTLSTAILLAMVHFQGGARLVPAYFRSGLCSL